MDKKVEAYIDAHKDEYIAVLQRLCSQKSLSTTGEGIPEMVELVQKELKKVGIEPVLYPTGGNPVIYGTLPGKTDHVFGFYDHYDVQPEGDEKLWISPPYDIVIRDGQIWGRGVADNKNGIACKLCAIDAWQKVYGYLPCGIKFIIEGEEETGSPHLQSFADAHPELLPCDGYNWESGYKEEDGPAEVVFGNKGLLYVELRVRTAKMDSHSCNAGIVKNPAWRLVQALGSLKDAETDRVLIDGFYDDVRPLTQLDYDVLEGDPFDQENFKRHMGMDEFLCGAEGNEVLRRLYYEPTANIAGLCSGFTTEGSKTVLPAEAFVKMDFRLVPDQDPDKIFAQLRKHLDEHGFTDVEAVMLSSQPAFRTDPNSPFALSVKKALTELFGSISVHHSDSGTTPMRVFCEKQGIPAALFGGTSAATSNIHAPNEHISVKTYMEEIKMMAAVMEALAEQDQENA